MATLQATRNPTGRIDAGDAVIDAAETTDTAPIKSRFGKFVKVHGAYQAGEAAVRAAYAKQRDGEQLLGGRLAEQDAAIDKLARQMIAAGADKQNPFRALKIAAPSLIKEQSQEAQPKTIGELVSLVQKSETGKEVLAAATALSKAAAAVAAAITALGLLEAAHEKTRNKREALSRPWETELAKLKRAARTADDEHGTELFATLFVDTAKPGPSRAGRESRVAQRKGLAAARATHKDETKAQRAAIADLARQLAEAKARLRALLSNKP